MAMLVHPLMEARTSVSLSRGVMDDAGHARANEGAAELVAQAAGAPSDHTGLHVARQPRVR